VGNSLNQIGEPQTLEFVVRLRQGPEIHAESSLEIKATGLILLSLASDCGKLVERLVKRTFMQMEERREAWESLIK
jgi:hypothetical protein